MFDVLSVTNGAAWPTVLGGAAGVLALAWNVWHAITDRRPYVEVTCSAELVWSDDELPEPKGYDVAIVAANVGRTTETAIEVGVGFAEGGGLSRRRFGRADVTSLKSQVGAKDRQIAALEAIAAELSAGRKSDRGMFIGLVGPRYRGESSPWPLPPGAAAEGVIRLDLNQVVESGSAALRPYVRLARGTFFLGKAISLDLAAETKADSS